MYFFQHFDYGSYFLSCCFEMALETVYFIEIHLNWKLREKSLLCVRDNHHVLRQWLLLDEDFLLALVLTSLKKSLAVMIF